MQGMRDLPRAGASACHLLPGVHALLQCCSSGQLFCSAPARPRLPTAVHRRPPPLRPLPSSFFDSAGWTRSSPIGSAAGQATTSWAARSRTGNAAPPCCTPLWMPGTASRLRSEPRPPPPDPPSRRPIFSPSCLSHATALFFRASIYPGRSVDTPCNTAAAAERRDDCRDTTGSWAPAAAAAAALQSQANCTRHEQPPCLPSSAPTTPLHSH